MTPRGRRAPLLALALAAEVACGIKAPPRPPLPARPDLPAAAPAQEAQPACRDCADRAPGATPPEAKP